MLAEAMNNVKYFPEKFSSLARWPLEKAETNGLVEEIDDEYIILRNLFDLASEQQRSVEITEQETETEAIETKPPREDN